jgi:hypothetical protein
MSSPAFTYRNLGPDNDPLRGQGQANFLVDLPAVAQAIQTRLLLFQGEWFADLADGTPYWQSIVAQGAGSNLPQINLLLTQRILATPFVNGVSNIQSSFNASNNRLNFSAVVSTQFGVLSVSNYPTPLSQVIQS